MKKVLDMVISWLDTAREAPRLKAAGFHFCQDRNRWMIADHAFPSRHSAMECLRRMEVREACWRCVP